MKFWLAPLCLVRARMEETCMTLLLSLRIVFVVTSYVNVQHFEPALLSAECVPVTDIHTSRGDGTRPEILARAIAPGQGACR